MEQLPYSSQACPRQMVHGHTSGSVSGPSIWMRFPILTITPLPAPDRSPEYLQHVQARRRPADPVSHARPVPDSRLLLAIRAQPARASVSHLDESHDTVPVSAPGQQFMPSRVGAYHDDIFHIHVLDPAGFDFSHTPRSAANLSIRKISLHPLPSTTEIIKALTPGLSDR